MPPRLAVWLFVLSSQVAMLVLFAAASATLGRLRPAGARLLYWRFVVLACLALPVLPVARPSQTVIPTAVGVVVATTVEQAPSSAGPGASSSAAASLVVFVLAGGMAMRALWLLSGFLRLRRMREAGCPVETGEYDELVMRVSVSFRQS